MIRLLVVLVLGIAAVFYFPDSRMMLLDATESLWVPVVKWDVEEEMRQVGRDVVSYEETTGQLPDRKRWLEWLDFRYAGEDLATDVWGNTYELEVWADSVGIVSWGPDRTRATQDDFVVTTPRRTGR